MAFGDEKRASTSRDMPELKDKCQSWPEIDDQNPRSQSKQNDQTNPRCKASPKVTKEAKKH
jgi:hypothetical protein